VVFPASGSQFGPGCVSAFVRGSATRSGDRAPEVVGVLGIIEGDYGVANDRVKSAKSGAVCTVAKP